MGEETGTTEGEGVGADWAQSFRGLAQGLSEEMCNFRVGNRASEPKGRSFSLIEGIEV